MGLRVFQGSGFRAASGFSLGLTRVYGLVGVEGLGFIWLGFKGLLGVQALIGVEGLGFWVCLGFRVWGLGFSLGLWLRIVGS